MKLYALMCCIAAALLFAPTDVDAWPPFKSKPKAKNGVSNSNNNSAASVDNRQHNQAESRVARLKGMKAREIPGAYRDSKNRNDKLTAFDGDWKSNGFLASLIGLAENRSSMMAGVRITLERTMVARGISLLPTTTQLNALKTYNQDPNAISKPGILSAIIGYRDDLQLHAAEANFEIERKAPNSIYDTVVFDSSDPYAQFDAALDHYGNHGGNNNNIYTPGPAHDHHH